MTKDEKKTMDNEVKNFMQAKQKGEFRNRIGRVLWPVYRRFVAPAALVLSGAVLATNPAAWPGALLMGGMVAASMPITKGYKAYLNNWARSNAALFGRSLKTKDYTPDQKTYAIEQFLAKNAPLFRSQKETSEELSRLAQGRPITKENNLIANLEHNINQSINRGPVSLKQRIKIYQKTFQQTFGKAPEDQPIASPTIPEMQQETPQSPPASRLKSDERE